MAFLGSTPAPGSQAPDATMQTRSHPTRSEKLAHVPLGPAGSLENPSLAASAPGSPSPHFR